MTISRNLKDFSQFQLIIFIPLLFSIFKVHSIETIEWQLIKSSNTIKVYQSHDNNSDFNQIKAELIVRSSLSGFLLFLQDTANIPKWLDNASHSEIIAQNSPSENVFITHFEGVWPVRDRNMVIATSYKQNNDLSIDIYVEDAADKARPIKNSVRVTVIHAHWHIAVIENTSNIKISYKFNVNPNGNIPSWLANQMTLTSVWNTLNAIQQQLPSSEWQQYQIKAIIEPKSYN